MKLRATATSFRAVTDRRPATLAAFAAVALLGGCATGLGTNAGVEVIGKGSEVLVRWTAEHPRDQLLQAQPAMLQVTDERNRRLAEVTGRRSAGLREVRFALPDALRSAPDSHLCMAVYLGRGEPLPVRINGTGQGPSNGFRYPEWEARALSVTKQRLAEASFQEARKSATQVDLIERQAKETLESLLSSSDAPSCEAIRVQRPTDFDSRFDRLRSRTQQDEAGRELCIWRVHSTERVFERQLEARVRDWKAQVPAASAKVRQSHLEILSENFAFAFDQVGLALDTKTGLGSTAGLREQAREFQRDQKRYKADVVVDGYKPLIGRNEYLRPQQELAQDLAPLVEARWSERVEGTPPRSLRLPPEQIQRIVAAHLLVYERCVSEATSQIANEVASLDRWRQNAARETEARSVRAKKECRAQEERTAAIQQTAANARAASAQAQERLMEARRLPQPELPRTEMLLNANACR